jgi:hypothetical protein
MAERTISDVFGAIDAVEGMFTGPIKYISGILGTVETNVRILLNLHLVAVLLGFFIRANVSDCASNLENSSID